MFLSYSQPTTGLRLGQINLCSFKLLESGISSQQQES